MESFLVELQNVLAVIEEDKMPDSEYQRIYDYITQNLDEHAHGLKLNNKLTKSLLVF